MNAEDKIIKIVNKSNYQKGKLISANNILARKQMTLMGDDKIQTFYVKSANNESVYLVQIITKNKQIISTNCTCPMCDEDGALVQYSDIPSKMLTNRGFSSNLGKSFILL